MQKRYPFKFLDAYTRADSDFFFGRNDEIDTLYQMVFQTDLLLVYGASGTGKTSLIQCGLASRFQSHDWLALNVRRGNNLNESLEKALETAGQLHVGVTSSQPVPARDADLDWIDEDLSTETGTTAPAEPLSPLARQFKAIYLRHFKPLYLIFDQFEELYILGSKGEQQQFVQTVREILRVKQPVKIVLSIREEYLGHLYEFERAVPELLRKKLRVEPMNLDKVKTVIESTGSRPDSLVRLRPGEETAIAEGIFEKIRGEEKTLHIPLPYLQVFLDKLYLHATGDKTRQKEVEFKLEHLAGIGDLGDVLRNFLDEQVYDIAAELPAAEERVWQMLSPFVTLEGTKEPLSESDLADRIPGAAPELLRRALQAFVAHRILRFSEAAQLYEIAHDSLAKQIHAKRSDEEIALLEVQRLVRSQTAMKAEAREFFSEKQLLFMEPYLSKYRPSAEEDAWIRQSREYVRMQKEQAEERQQAELEATQKRLRTVRGLLGAAVLAVLVAMYFGWDANRAKVRALQNERIANNATASAVEASQLAKKATQNALDSAVVAQQQRQFANQKVLETLQANENTAEALSKLEITADQALSIVLPDIDRNIYRLEYDLTYPKCRTAINLKARRREVEKRIWEMAYFYTEADSAAAAIAFLNLLEPAAIATNSPNIQAKLRNYLAKAIPADFMDSLHTRYYPRTILVAGGSFLREDSAQIQVNSFRMGQTEITYWQYNLFARNQKHHIEPPSWEYAGDNPAVYVNWYDAVSYLNWLSIRHGKKRVYELTNPRPGPYNTDYDVEIDPAANGYRLPTEAEWEFAARGGNRSQEFEYSGSNELREMGWYRHNSDSRTHPVAQKKANELDLYDMSGNAWEWCQDWYADYDSRQTDNPREPAVGSFRVLRGGSWDNYPEDCRVSYRRSNDPDYRSSNIGFRLVLVP